MNDVKQLWNEFQKTPFPSELAGPEIYGIDPVEIDAFAAGCISSFIDNGGLLEAEKKKILNNCMSELKRINPTLVADSQVYFGKLYRLCDIVYSRS